MEPIKYLTDEEIKDILKSMGIDRDDELNVALAEYKKYWVSVYFPLRKDMHNQRPNL
jgi:hypothetical protein